ncbi:arylamine N-acetyltransferase family protein [Brevibacillus ginsengisoli]|uniref:arylamine N-acetyltransferase family protein n=1 Tax=Brevibacillus ginsengisoli TaxID=363854 RepID=UPI003CF6EBAB
MSELNVLFRTRIGISENEKITFETLDHVLEKTALAIPFENLGIIQNKTQEISKEHLLNKLLLNNEGGLCYELNSMLYFFLVENGFDAVLASGVVYDHAAQTYQNTGRTHVTILVTHQEQTYLVDTGFGGNLPLKPVPLTGETVTSWNGEFRIGKVDCEYGDYALEIKLKHKDTDWRTGYAFYTKKPTMNITELNEIQTIITSHDSSPFNKHPLITKLTTKGNSTLTNASFTQWDNGIVTKEEIDDTRFIDLLRQHFGLTSFP